MDDSVVLSYPEWPASTFSVDYSGRRAVLVVQKWLAVVRLDASRREGESRALKKLAKQNKCEIKSALWCPVSSRQNYIVSTSQQKLEVWDSVAERNTLVCSIRAHTRPISGLSWSFTDANLIGSCAVDTYVHVWDVRETRKPSFSFRAVAGASLVQWNRRNGNLLASAHDTDVRIWDTRKPTTALGYISAHMQRINDLDWSHWSAAHLTTCSQDASIKLWDTAAPREPTRTIKTGSQPIWRARNYPLGQGVAMALVPAMHSGDNRVFLWGHSDALAPLHVFTGHSEPVLDVQWRRCRDGYQLVSLSRDRTLRFWSLPEQTRLELSQSAASAETPAMRLPPPPEECLVDNTSKDFSPSHFGQPDDDLASSHLSLSLSSTLTLSQSPQSSDLEPPKPRAAHQTATFSPQGAHTLNQEFSLLNLDIPNLEVERLDAGQRSCTVAVKRNGELVRLGVNFPLHYPNGAAPSFIFDKKSTVDFSVIQELQKVLNETSQNYIQFNRPCLEPCLRKMAKAMESFVNRPKAPKQPDFTFVKLEDEHIPFPRTSGARFSANGMLAFFTFNHPQGADHVNTPRSMDKLNAYMTHIHSGSYGTGKRMGAYHVSSSLPKRGSSGGLAQMAVEKLIGDKGSNSVYVCDITHMLPVDYELAKSYSLNGDSVRELCSVNASVAYSVGRQDLVKIWSVAALVAEEDTAVSTDPYAKVPWACHPFGRGLIHSLFDHFAQLRDVQTLAVLSCVFQLHCDLFERRHPSLVHRPHPPLPPSPSKTAGTGQVFVWQDGGEGEVGIEEQTAHELNLRLLDGLLADRCNEYRRCYANILYGWSFLDQRAEVLKFQSSNPETNIEIGFKNVCGHCSDPVPGPACDNSHCFAVHCAICNLAIRGSSTFCLACGHGGHTRHLQEWFSQQSLCPSGCGCSCLENSGWS